MGDAVGEGSGCEVDAFCRSGDWFWLYAESEKNNEKQIVKCRCENFINPPECSIYLEN